MNNESDVTVENNVAQKMDNINLSFDCYKDSELIIGLVCASGTNLSEEINSISNQLSNLNHTTEVIDVAGDILKDFEKRFNSLNIKIEHDYHNEFPEGTQNYTKTHRAMDIGNQLRKYYGDNALALAIISKIREIRTKYWDQHEHEITEEREKTPHGKAQKPIPHTVFIIKSLKHEEEVHFLSSLYKKGFYLFSVFENSSSRKEYLTYDKGMKESEADDIIERDEDEGKGYGQHTRNAFQMADFFIHHDNDTKSIRASIKRIIYLIFGNPFATPTFGEYAMFCAFGASLRSADLARQVGAVICKDNDVLATGTNECNKYGGGQYWPKDDYTDIVGGRDYTRNVDANKLEIMNIINDLFNSLNENGTPLSVEKFNNIVSKTGIKDITEFGRPVHAEMDALSTCNRNGIITKSTVMYCTTFPCHNCTKHIIASGVTKVVYIEPYPKSKSLALFNDSVTTNHDENEKVLFTPFIGVGPRRFIELFKMKFHPLPDKKRRMDDSEIKNDWENSQEKNIRDQLLPTNYLQRELLYELEYKQKILDDLNKKNELKLDTKIEKYLSILIEKTGNDINNLNEQIEKLFDHEKNGLSYKK